MTPVAAANRAEAVGVFVYGQGEHMNPTSSEVPSETLVSIACLTDVGRVRKSNQDAFIVTDLTEAESLSTSGELLKRPVGMHGLLLAVADGMGGALAGDVASKIAIEQLSLQLISASEKRPVSGWLRQAIKAANREIRRVSGANPAYQGMGATMTAAVIHDGKAIIAQVGDSRGYMIREGHIQQVTKDQSLVQAMLDAGQLTEEAARDFHFRNVILKALGAEDEVEPDISVITLVHGDYLLLCSDGLSNKVGNVEMHDTILEAESLAAACDRLVALANERGGEDNITLVVACFEGEGLPVVEDGLEDSDRT
jgi:serine/threonine protein phosphatase PrpC